LLVKVLVYNLGLAISLRVEYGRELNLNPKDTVEFILEIRYKLGAIVRDNWFRSAVELVDIINVEVSYILYSYSLKIKKGDRLLI
jgi:hypothetical protein